MNQQQEFSQPFLEISSMFFAEYRDKIRACLELLSDEEVWWRPNEASNSIGNLLLHVTGSMRQWIVSGIGGASVQRVRQQEFDERTQVSKIELFARLDAAVNEVDGVLARMDSSRLLERFRIFEKERTWMFTIYHMVEHFSMHTGQILMIAKMKTGEDLRL
jgi:uncharacterized damage-inducible protein DinB